MQQPAIQAALDNLVEVIRTALTAEFLEYFRGDAAPIRGKGGKTGPKSKAKATKKVRSTKPAKKAGRRAA